MGLARFLATNHSKIAAVVLPISVLGGFVYTMKTGESPFTSHAQGEEGRGAQQSMYTLNFKLGGIGSK